VNFHALADDWPVQRARLQRVATHVVAQARFRLDGLFDLMPSPGGFGTPMAGPRRERVRLVGGSMFVERVVGADIDDAAATTDVVTVAGSSIRQLCAAIGFEPDPGFWVGGDTPPPGDPDEPLYLDGLATQALGEWYLLGQRAIDEAIASLPGADASVGRLWPEHFDYGVDLAAAPGVRTNLGAAAGDAVSDEPYLYVGPWEVPQPGSSPYWNAPFGAMLSYGELDAAADPLGRAIEFFLHGIAHLRSP
jgi:hypothetical protein